jgi:hypothetical protein
MARVTKPGGNVAACVWDGPTGPLGRFWQLVHELDPGADDESHLAGAQRGHLAQLFAAAGLEQIETQPISVDVVHPSFEEWWEPYTLGVGPAGDYVANLDRSRQARLAVLARAAMGDGPFVVSATAWAARGSVP